MKQILLLVLALLSAAVSTMAQAPVATPAATETIQQSQSSSSSASPAKAGDSAEPANLKSPAPEAIPIKVPAGTAIDVEVAYTVNSRDIKPGELLSFRVLIPVIIDGVTAIERDALVTARVTIAKRGGHWGKAGRLAWEMDDVVAADNSRIRLDPATRSRTEALWSLENKAGGTTQQDQGRVQGTSHKSEVVTRTIIYAAIFPPLAPLSLMHGFRRGEDAVLPEGKRYVVVVRSDTSLTASPKN